MKSRGRAAACGSGQRAPRRACGTPRRAGSGHPRAARGARGAPSAARRAGAAPPPGPALGCGAWPRGRGRQGHQDPQQVVQPRGFRKVDTRSSASPRARCSPALATWSSEAAGTAPHSQLPPPAARRNLPRGLSLDGHRAGCPSLGTCRAPGPRRQEGHLAPAGMAQSWGGWGRVPSKGERGFCTKPRGAGSAQAPGSAEHRLQPRPRASVCTCSSRGPSRALRRQRNLPKFSLTNYKAGTGWKHTRP